MSLLQVNIIRNKTGAGAPVFDRGLNASGTSSLGNVQISAGIITASSGIVTYYGDGQYLQNITTNIISDIETSIIGIATITNLSGTNLNFSGIVTASQVNTGTLTASQVNTGTLTASQVNTGILTASQVNTGTLTASGNVTAENYFGNGSNLTGIVTSITAGSGISVDQSTGNVTITATGGGGVSVESYWSQTSIGIHTLSNVGVGTTNPTSALTIQGDANISGVTTSSGGFVGNLTGDVTGTATTSTNSNNTNITNDTSSSSTHYPTFVSNVSGYRPQKVTSSRLTFVPSTGTLGITSINCSGTIIVGTLIASSVNYNGNVSITGDLNVLGDISSSSDINLKENIKTVENSLNTIEQLRGVSFDWKETGKSSYGVIAQELEEILPELVKDGEVKSVNYNGLIGVLIEAVKELSEEVKELKKYK
jgi:hypothetical protein